MASAPRDGTLIRLWLREDSSDFIGYYSDKWFGWVSNHEPIRFCQHSRQSRFLGNLIAQGFARMTESGSFLLSSIIEIARYGKFGANADRTNHAACCARFRKIGGCSSSLL